MSIQAFWKRAQLTGPQCEWLQHVKVNTPVFEIPNGFAPNEVCPECSVHWSKEGIVRLLYMGRLDSHHKGLHLLIDAMAELTNTFALHLVMQGPDGGDRKHLEERVARLHLSDRVSFLDADFTGSASEIIGNYAIFCLPSRFDCFRLSALEAMLGGRALPVSATSGIALRVQASGCDVVVQPEVLSIQQGLRDLLQRRPQWKNMGTIGRCYALGKNWRVERSAIIGILQR